MDLRSRATPGDCVRSRHTPKRPCIIGPASHGRGITLNRGGNAHETTSLSLRTRWLAGRRPVGACLGRRRGQAARGRPEPDRDDEPAPRPAERPRRRERGFRARLRPLGQRHAHRRSPDPPVGGRRLESDRGRLPPDERSDRPHRPPAHPQPRDGRGQSRARGPVVGAAGGGARRRCADGRAEERLRATRGRRRLLRRRADHVDGAGRGADRDRGAPRTGRTGLVVHGGQPAQGRLRARRSRGDALGRGRPLHRLPRGLHRQRRSGATDPRGGGRGGRRDGQRRHLRSRRQAAGSHIEPNSDLHASEQYRRDITAALTRRAVAQAAARCAQEG